jgi:hypothetical protein
MDEFPQAANSLTDYLLDVTKALPVSLRADVASEQIVTLHEEHGGATFNLHFGNLSGQKLFAVSLYPKRGLRIAGDRLSSRLIEAFIKRNTDLLDDPRCAVGTWFDEESGYTYLDITATLPDKKLALELGRQYNQIAIFDLERSEIIDTGGDGSVIEDMLTETERLPPLLRG